MLDTRTDAMTLSDVARQAGVSHMTVSNVINGKSSVRPATRQRVLDAIQATGYRVNPVARALAGGRSRVISVFTRQMNRPYASEVVQGAAQAAATLHHDLIVMMLSGNAASDLSMLTRFSAGALLIQPSRDDRWRSADLPRYVVSVDGPGECSFTVDNYGGARQAMQHLLDLGHTRIGFISGLDAEGRRSSNDVRDCDDAVERLRGYQDGLEQAGLNVPNGYVQHGNYSKASGEAATQKLLNLKKPPSALFVSGDAMALGAMHAAQNRGIQVPSELSVVGFDDLPIAAAARPGLTTVRQPLQYIGEVAVRHLVALIEGQVPSLPPPFPTELVRRESTARPQKL